MNPIHVSHTLNLSLYRLLPFVFSNSKSFLSLANERNDCLAAISYLSSLVQNSIQQCLWDLIFFAELSVILPNKVAHKYSFQKAGKAYLHNVQCIVIECIAKLQESSTCPVHSHSLSLFPFFLSLSRVCVKEYES